MGLRRRLQELLGLHQATSAYENGEYDAMDGYPGLSESRAGYGDDASPHSAYEANPYEANPANNVITMPGASSFQSELVIMEPYSFQEVPAAIMALRDRKVVVLNLGNLEAEEAQRSVDYVAGGTFALDGHQERIGKCVFLFTPHSVQITAQTAAAMGGSETPGYPPPPPPPGHRPASTPEQEMLRQLKIQTEPDRSAPSRTAGHHLPPM
ncbi:MAG: cell division protein SepF [Leptolyngbyaceae cyanobacterium]